MNEQKKQKIIRFMNDELMSQSVFEIIRDNFLKSRGVTDVNYLASKSLAIELLIDAWKELSLMKTLEDKEEKISRQIGL